MEHYFDVSDIFIKVMRIQQQQLMIQNLGLGITITRILIVLLTYAAKVNSVDLNLLSLTVKPQDPQINADTQYQWNFSFINPPPTNISEITLKFPDCTKLSSTDTQVFSESLTTNPLSIISQSQISVTFRLPSSTDNSTYYFIVKGVKNCPYKGWFYDIHIKTDLSSAQLKKPGKFVKIQAGKITDMALRFDGQTGDTASTLNIGFTAVNPVLSNDVIIKISYPNYKYSDDGVHIFDHDTTPNAQLTVNIQSRSTTCALNSGKMQCEFPNLQLTGDQNINLKLSPVTNPITANNYYDKTTDFQISIFDDSAKEYDITVKYEISQIGITEYKGQIAGTNKVNSDFLLTSLQIPSLPPKIQQNDLMKVFFTSGQLSLDNCGQLNNFSLSRGSGSTIVFQYKDLEGDYRRYIATSANTNTGTANIYFDVCYFRMPLTSQQIYFQLIFSTKGGEDENIDDYSPYMKITATLLPDPGTLTSQQILLTPNLFTITQLASYTYSFSIKQPLSNHSMFLLSFPSDIDLTEFKLDLESNCDILVEGSNVPTFRCYENKTNEVIFENEMMEGLAVGSQIQISLHNIRNPFHPVTYDQFSVWTYYNWADHQSLVEVGTNIESIKYTPLVASLVVDPNSFEVNKLENIVIKYTPQIQIQLNSVIRLVFNSNFNDIAVQELSNIQNDLTDSQNNQWTFIIKEKVTKSTVIPIVFQAKTPSKIGFHSCLSLSLETDGDVYEVTDGEIQLIVDQLASEAFKVGSNKLRTGEQSEFTFQFEEKVEHDNQFLLQIYFPEDIQIVRENLECSGCTNLQDRSTGGIDILQVQITKTQIQKQTLTFRIKGIQNRKSVGNSGLFKLKALTINQEEVSESYSSLYIEKPNIITGNFVPTNDYYRGNSEPVQITLKFFNKLVETDYVEVDFTDQSYSIKSAVSCIQAICSSYFVPSSKITTITMKPSSIQVFNNPINFTIIGLVSNQNTLYGQQRIVNIRSFSDKKQRIDEGSIIYEIGCSDIKEKNCKKCNGQKCTECYDSYNLLNSQGICTNNCGDTSKYETFDNSGVCQPCVSPCQTCDDATICRTCIDNHFFYKDGTCSPFCDTKNGYYISGTDCLRCQDSIFCLYCIGDIGEDCLVCDQKISKEGKCVDSCPERYIEIQGTCYQCDKSCLTCSQTINNCTACNYGYINVSNICMSSCPQGLVNQITGQTSICTCTGDCQKCENQTDICLSCLDKTKYLYNSQCLNECPISTFPVGKSCKNCQGGCKKCTQTTCLQCLDKLYIYENSCFTDCNSINETFINPINSLKCIQCPQGCDQCDEVSLECKSCIQDSTKKYILTQDKRCLMQCQIERTCDLQSQVDPIVPLPGTISLLIWGAILAIIWIFFNKNVYIPYALIYVGCLVQLFVLFYTVSQNNAKILKLESTRLLQQSQLADNYLNISLFLLLGWIGLNFLGNIAHIFIFCYYTKKMIPNRQIHRITNYIVLIFASLTSFKFGLIAYSRMFPSPYLQIKRQRQLRPLHILTGLFIFGYDLLMAASGALLIAFSPSSPMTTTYLLGIDLILMCVFFIIVFIYILAVPKNDHYFKQIKKYAAEEHYKTQENLYEDSISKNNDLKIQQQQSTIKKNKKPQETSKANLLRQEPNKKIFKLRDQDIQDIEEEEQSDELPTIGPNGIKIIPKQSSQKMDNISDRKTKRKTDLEADNYKADQTIENLDEEEIGNHEMKTIEKPIDQTDKFKISSTVSYPEKVSSFRKKVKNPNKIINIDIQQSVSNKNRKGNHSQTSLVKINKIGSMKKKNQISHGHGHSQAGDDKDIDEVDFESIIQTKMIDRSLNIQKQAKRNKSDRKLQKDGSMQYQQISPSWFNIENQRYDLDDADQN